MRKQSALIIAAAMLIGSPQVAFAGATPRTTRITFHKESASSNASRDTAAGRAALRNVAAAQGEIQRVLNELRRAFEESPELRDARSALRVAQANYQDAVNAALAPARQSAEYKQAAERVLSLERKLAWGYVDDHMTDRQRADTATALFKARRDVSAIESQAIAADENVTNARFALIDANGQVIGMQRAFQESIQSDPAFLEARSRLDAAREQIASAR